jgi:hypothetical protein
MLMLRRLAKGSRAGWVIGRLALLVLSHMKEREKVNFVRKVIG